MNKDNKSDMRVAEITLEVSSEQLEGILHAAWNF
jgi:hypothetical protein